MRHLAFLITVMTSWSLLPQSSQASTAWIVNSGHTSVTKSVVVNGKDVGKVDLKPGESLKIEAPESNRQIALEAYSSGGVSKATGTNVYTQISGSKSPIVGVAEKVADIPELITSARVKSVIRTSEVTSVEVR